MPVPRVMLQLRSISARSSAGTGIRHVSFAVSAGGVHALLGENLSGASEILAVISGYLSSPDGVLEIDGQVCNFSGASDATAAGVGLIRGSAAVIPHLSIAENVYLGHEKSMRGFIRFRKLYADAG